jgi:hypothetical protein
VQGYAHSTYWCLAPTSSGESSTTLKKPAWPYIFCFSNSD